MKNQPTRIALPQSTLSRHRGFTLVELLVVITIIAVLAALTMTLTQNIRAKAYQANALSAARQVAAFSAAYSTENNGDINTLRYGGDPKEGGGAGWVKNTFWGRLQPQLFPDISTNNQSRLNMDLRSRLNSLFTTKDSGKMPMTILAGGRIYHDTSGLPVPFAFNSKLAPWGKFVKTSNVSDPSQVLHFTYGFGMFAESSGEKYVEMPPNGQPIKCSIYFQKDKKAIAAFVDGHVESVSAPLPKRNFELQFP